MTTSPASNAPDRIQLGAHTLPYRAHSLDRALEGIARAGYRYAGLWNDHADRPLIPHDAPASTIDDVRRRFDAHSLIPSMAFRFPSDPADKDPAAPLRRTLEVAGALGIPFVISTGPSPYRRAPHERKRDMLFHRESETYFHTLRAVAPLAARAAVTIVLKPHMGVTGTGEDLAELVTLIDHPHVRVCYDAGNIAYYEGLKPEEDVKACAHLTRAVCIKDHRGDRFHPDFPIPGEGDVDHAAIFRTLLDAGFAGPCLVERVDGTQKATDMPPHTIDSALTRARTHLAEAVTRATHNADGATLE